MRSGNYHAEAGLITDSTRLLRNDVDEGKIDKHNSSLTLDEMNKKGIANFYGADTATAPK